MNLIEAASAAKDAPADNSWVAITVAVVALGGSIAGTVFAPWLRERAERKERAKAERRSEIRRLIIVGAETGDEYATATLLGEHARASDLLRVTMRYINELEMWLLSEEMEVAAVMRVSQMPLRRDSIELSATKLIAGSAIMARWYRGEVPAKGLLALYGEDLAARVARREAAGLIPFDGTDPASAAD